MPQFINAIQQINTTYKPKIAMIVVKKKIHTRLFVSPGSPGRLQNPPPGTIVDTECVNYGWYDFLLVSQSVKQGTVTPTHYHIIFDTTNLHPDRMQQLVYKTCHLYYNWPGTVRVPAPCQYAHKAAYLVSQAIHKEPDKILRENLFFL